jgi:hypothetical protein
MDKIVEWLLALIIILLPALQSIASKRRRKHMAPVQPPVRDEGITTPPQEEFFQDVAEPVDTILQTDNTLQYIDDKIGEGFIRPQVAEEPIDDMEDTIFTEQETDTAFNLRQAVIYSEILNRKY